MQDKENPQENNLVHDFNEQKPSMFTPKLMAIFVGVIILGVGSGYLLSVKTGGGSSPISTSSSGTSSAEIKKGATFGSNDTKTFKDTAEGTLANGGIENEGQFHLVRLGGDSQNVYMTSSSVDLSKFVGKKIKVWGQTQTAQHAGWLMDVGKVEVL
jgi:hypothetical protein